MHLKYLFFLIVLLFIYCTPQKKLVSVASAPIKIQECLPLIPDSLLSDIAFNGLLIDRFTPERATLLTKEGKITQNESFLFVELTKLNDAQDFISLQRTGSDTWVSYDLKLWKNPKNRQFLGICQTIGEMCCSYSNFSLYRVENGHLIDVTKEKIPLVRMSEFIVPEFIPKSEQNSSSWTIELKPDDTSVSFHLDIDGVSLSLEEGNAVPVEEYVKTWVISMGWLKEEFRKK